MTFSDKIKNLRFEKKLTQEEIAEKVGIGQSTYAQYESGKRKPSPEKLEKLAKVLNVSPNYLLGWEDESNMDKMTIYIDKLIENTVNEKIVWKYIEPYLDDDDIERYSEYHRELFRELTEYDNYVVEEGGRYETYECAFSKTAILFHCYTEISKYQLLAISKYENGKNSMIITPIERNRKLTELFEAIQQVRTGFKIETLDNFISDLQELEKE